MPPKPDYDSALKRLLLRAHESFLCLIAPGVTWHGELSPELPATARRADFAWEVTPRDGRRGILRIELQTKPDATIGERVEEGRAEALREAARTTLQNRFGALSEDIGTAINTAGEAVLFEIITHVTTETLAEVRARLGLT